MLRDITLEELPIISNIDEISNVTNWQYYQYIDSFHSATQKIIGYYIGQEIVGFVVLQSILDEVEVLQFVISVNYQSHGHGSAMFLSLIEYLAKLQAKYLFLEARQDNQVAIKLYQKHGMQIYNIRNNYYNIDNYTINAVLMKLEL